MALHDDLEAMARLVVHAMPAVVGARVGASQEGYAPGFIVRTLAFHLEKDEWQVRAGMRMAVKKGWLSAPVRKPTESAGPKVLAVLTGADGGGERADYGSIRSFMR